MEGSIKKRSYLLLRPERHLILLRDGSFAYFKKSNTEPPILKAFFCPCEMSKVVLDAKKLELTTRKKTYHFYFPSTKIAQSWALAFKSTCEWIKMLIKTWQIIWKNIYESNFLVNSCYTIWACFFSVNHAMISACLSNLQIMPK